MDTIKYFDIEQLLLLDLEFLYEVVSIMQRCSLDNIITSLSQIYQVTIARMLELKDYQEGIRMVRRLHEIDGSHTLLIAFALDIFASVFPDFSDNHKDKML